MAFVMGIRLASYAIAGVAVIITHETAKGAKEKLRQWVVDKFTSRSSDQAPQPPKPCDADRKDVNEGGDFVNGEAPADIQEPTLSPTKVTENAVKADPKAEGDNAVNGVRPANLEEPALTAVNVTENAVESDPTVEQSQPNQGNAINVPVSGEFPSHVDAESHNAANGDLTAEPRQQHGVNPTREAPALMGVDAVSLESTSVHRTVADVDNAVRVGETRAMDKSCQTDSDELGQDAPDPDPPPGPGKRGSFVAAAVNAVKAWARWLFNWRTATNGDGLNPKVRKKMRRTLVRVGLQVMESALGSGHKVPLWRQIYNIVKNELLTVPCS